MRQNASQPLTPATEDTNHAPLFATVALTSVDCDPDSTDAVAASTKLVWKMMILLEMTKLVIAKIPDDPPTVALTSVDCYPDSTDVGQTEVALAD